MKKLLLGFLLCINSAFSAPVNSVATSDDGAFNAYRGMCRQSFNGNMFGMMEDILRQNDKGQNKDENGLEFTTICLWNDFNNPDSLNKWQTQYPNSIYPVLARQSDLTQRFFKIRGSGYINTIPKETLVRAFTELENGAKEMDSVKKFGATPAWYSQRIKIAFLQPDRSIFLNTVAEAIGTFPDSTAIYRSASASMLPQWGFSYKDLDQFARLGMQSSKLKEEIYTTVYTSVATPCCSNKIVDAGYFDKKIYRKGVDAILKKYPTQLNYNRYAQFSCLLGDIDSAKYFMQKKMKVHVQAAWFEGHYDHCSKLIKSNH